MRIDDDGHAAARACRILAGRQRAEALGIPPAAGREIPRWLSADARPRWAARCSRMLGAGVNSQPWRAMPWW